ncbi:UvrD-helicase domain-containing protein [Candidatus Gottesmanbacteria bacterium]|nr:UvrD-helicase domain-containing protein [Candidatus Gottesmanbacteria bacterium]
MENLILKHLNTEQIAAVKNTEGPIIILAGAGSGKTRVLTYKALYLMLEKKVSAENILLVTFTNKAANEMKARISNFLLENNQSIQGGSQKSTNLPFAGTYHSFCAKILRREGQHIGVEQNFVIYDEQDSKDAIKEAEKEMGLDPKRFNPGAVLSTISSAKNELISALEYPQIARGYFQEGVARIYLTYQRYLIENHALDFDDLISKTVELFRKNENIASEYQNKYSYILVDEYQDTNHAQYQLTKILAKRWRNISVVGDASQSIYGWRGADFKNITNFKKDFPDAKIFHLEQNYRSTQNILAVANHIISKNRSHPILKLWTEKQSGTLIKIYQAENEHDEADFIIKQIINHQKYSDFAVLYRTNAQSRVIEEVFLQSGIPYVLVGGVRFYERKEIKDIISYLRLLINSNDQVSYKRIEKLGKKKLATFIKFSDDFRNNDKILKQSTTEILNELLQFTAYLELYDPKDPEDISRLENTNELHSVATQFPDLIQFLENVALVEQEYYPDHAFLDGQKVAVTLMTMHAAKGLEFPKVFMIGMEEGLFPHSRTLLEPLELEEERRLCYVGMTRAKEELFLTFATRRLYFGQRNSNPVSRFVAEIPQHLTSLARNDYI